MKPGYQTTEFLATGAGIFLVTLLALLAAFHLITITEAQRQAVLEFAGVAWIVLPAAYTGARSFLKSQVSTVKQIGDRSMTTTGN